MRALLKRLEEGKFNERALKALGKLFGDWKEKLGDVYYGMEKVKRQPGVKEMFGGDMEELYNAMDDALLLAERLDKKVAKAMGEDVEIPEFKRKRAIVEARDRDVDAGLAQGLYETVGDIMVKIGGFQIELDEHGAELAKLSPKSPMTRTVIKTARSLLKSAKAKLDAADGDINKMWHNYEDLAEKLKKYK